MEPKLTNKNIHYLIIDPQNDFMDLPGAALGVPGATADMDRVAGIINMYGSELEDIHVTMDTHQKMAIFHAMFWRDKHGKRPAPFTVITHQMVQNGDMKPFHPTYAQWCLDYTKQLETDGRYALCIWPDHCLFGSWGHNVYEPLWQALSEWETKHFARVNFVQKGHNPFTEHYSAVKAEVIRDDDETTNLNTALLEMLADDAVDIILTSGEALSHCYYFTMRDLADHFGPDKTKKIYFVEDTASPVGTFEKQGQEALNEMKAKGMNIIQASDIPTLF